MTAAIKSNGLLIVDEKNSATASPTKETRGGISSLVRGVLYFGKGGLYLGKGVLGIGRSLSCIDDLFAIAKAFLPSPDSKRERAYKFFGGLWTGFGKIGPFTAIASKLGSKFYPEHISPASLGSFRKHMEQIWLDSLVEPYAKKVLDQVFGYCTQTSNQVINLSNKISVFRNSAFNSIDDFLAQPGSRLFDSSLQANEDFGTTFFRASATFEQMGKIALVASPIIILALSGIYDLYKPSSRKTKILGIVKLITSATALYMTDLETRAANLKIKNQY